MNQIKNYIQIVRVQLSFGKTTEIVVKAKSMGTLDSTNPSLSRTMKTRSLEVISNLALWSTSIVNIELNKSDHGLGFSCT